MIFWSALPLSARSRRSNREPAQFCRIVAGLPPRDINLDVTEFAGKFRIVKVSDAPGAALFARAGRAGAAVRRAAHPTGNAQAPTPLEGSMSSLDPNVLYSIVSRDPAIRRSALNLDHTCRLIALEAADEIAELVVNALKRGVLATALDVVNSELKLDVATIVEAAAHDIQSEHGKVYKFAADRVNGMISKEWGNA